jgi:hypothetical protein
MTCCPVAPLNLVPFRSRSRGDTCTQHGAAACIEAAAHGTTPAGGVCRIELDSSPAWTPVALRRQAAHLRLTVLSDLCGQEAANLASARLIPRSLKRLACAHTSRLGYITPARAGPGCLPRGSRTVGPKHVQPSSLTSRKWVSSSTPTQSDSARGSMPSETPDF